MAVRHEKSLHVVSLLARHHLWRLTKYNSELLGCYNQSILFREFRFFYTENERSQCCCYSKLSELP